MIALLILTVLLILSTFWLIKSTKNNWEVGFQVAVWATILSLFLLIVVSIEKDIKCTYTSTKVEVKPTLNNIVVIDSLGIREIKDYKIISRIDSTTKWYRENTVNFWGQKNIEDLVADFELKK
jgi:DMSO/TMAO reductase YedYZ heme-binding membrane subunit